jgi:SAM-dependent methyltransferase
MECDHGRVTERALSFGAVAATYEKYRPGYPDELVDEVLDYVGRPVRTALEIGAGTGKATRAFAGRGIAVTATDPDPDMLMELRKHVPATVTTVTVAFEDLPLSPVYDLVYAAASLHWTKPHQRWLRVAAMLTREGVFASFGGQVHLADSAVEQDVNAARSPLLADDGVPSPDGTPAESPLQWPGTELAKSDRFTDVRQSTIQRRMTVSARDYIGYLSTVSAYLQLPDPLRERVLSRILTVLPEQVALVADLTLHLARVVGSRDEDR